MGHKRAQFKQNAEPLSVGRTITERRGFGLWPSHRQTHLAIVGGHDNLPTALGKREKRVGSLTMSAPDPFDKRRVREPFIINDIHTSPPAIQDLNTIAIYKVLHRMARRSTTGNRPAVYLQFRE